jgi:sentrin-specific protease 1
VIPPSSTSTSSQAAKADNEGVESITEMMDKLLRTRTEEAERIVRAKELAEEKRIDDEIRAREEKIQKEKESEKAARNLLRPLSNEEHDRVQEALYGAGPLNEQLATSATDSVQRKSMQTLRPGTWLNDEVIHYFYKMLANRDEALTVVKPERKRSHFFMSFFFTKLFDEGNTNEYSYRNVKKWSKKVPGKDIFDLDKVFFACNVSQMHWTCAVIFIQEKRIQFYDSMGGEGYYYSEGLLQYLKDEWAAKKGGEFPDADKWEIIGAGPGVPQQRNGYDCGVFTCMFADFLSVNRPLSFNQAHITECRHRIALSVLKGVAIE